MPSSTSFNLFQWKENDSSKDESQRILQDKILNQQASTEKLESHDANISLDLVARKEKPNSTTNWASLLSTFGSISINNKDDKEGSNMTSLIETARDFIAAGQVQDKKSKQDMDKFQEELKAVMAQLDSTLAVGVGKDVKIDPVAFIYYLEHEDQRKNPSWKRRMHRYMPALDVEMVYALHDALYLAELSYVDTIEEIQQGLANYVGSPYELIYATVDSQPREPAHFLALRKEVEEQKEKKQPFLPWLGSGDTYLEVLLVVRGTKEIGDVLSDALLEASEYRSGKAHDGIAKSGKWLVETHLPLLKHLLEQSGRTKLKIDLVGHSLGAGTAAIACMEFNDLEYVEATSVGFGCPALVDKDLSEKHKDVITTVVDDSDCVPRMSGATLVNLILDVMSYDCRELALGDVRQMMDAINANIPLEAARIPADKREEILGWIRGEMAKRMEEAQPKARAKPRMPVELYPPGKCIHFFRDGVGITATYAPCEFFGELDVTRTMVDDHYIAPGYNKTFLDLMRAQTNSSKFQFHHDIYALRAEKPKEEDKKP